MTSSKTNRHVIMVYGAPGSGKTFFAQKFSKVFRAPLLDLNSLRHHLYGKPDYGKSENTTMRFIGEQLLTDLMLSDQTIILEGCLDKKKERDQVRQIAKDHGYDAELIWVQTDLATTRQRVVSHEHHKLTKKQFDNIVNELESPMQAEKPLVISGKHTFATQVKIVLGQLSK